MRTEVLDLYRVNFQDMPELRLTDGDPMLLATVVALWVDLYDRFKRAGRF